MAKKKKGRSSREKTYNTDRFDDLVRGISPLGYEEPRAERRSGTMGKGTFPELSLADRLSGDVLEKLRAIGSEPSKSESQPPAVSQSIPSSGHPIEPAPSRNSFIEPNIPPDAISHGIIDGAVWYLDGKRQLIIKPANNKDGVISRCGFGNYPWYKIRSKITKVVIEPGVAADRLDYAFEDCQSLIDADLSGLDASKLTGISRLFSGCNALKNVSFEGWSSQVLRDADDVFRRCPRLELVNVEKCHPVVVEKIEDALACNARCKVLKDIIWSGETGGISWRISEPGAEHNQGRLTLEPVKGPSGEMEEWGQGGPPWRQASNYITEVIVMPGVRAATLEGIFEDCHNLVSADLSELDVSAVTSMAKAFSGCSKLRSANLSGWKTSALRYFNAAFEGTSSEAVVDVRNWSSADSVKLLREVFPLSIKQRLESSLEDWEWHIPHGVAACGKTGSVMWWLTKGDDHDNPGHLRLKAIPGSDGLMGKYPADSWQKHAGDIRRLTAEKGVKAQSLDLAFSGLKNLISIELSKLDVSRSKSFSMMFSGCEHLETADLSAWKTVQLANTDEMFLGCRSLRRVSVDNWDTSNLTTAYAMFADCENLREMDLSSWKTDALGDCSNMFEGCSSLSSLDLAGWNFNDIEHYEDILGSCSRIKSLAISHTRENAPDSLLSELAWILPDSIKWLEEPPFSPGDKVQFGIMPQSGSRFTPIAWTVLESTPTKTTMLCDTVIDSCCSGIKSTSLSVDRYEELLTRDFNHFYFSKLEKENAGEIIRVSVPRAQMPVDVQSAVEAAPMASSWASRHGVDQDSQGRASWLAYDEAARSWGQGFVSKYPKAHIASKPLDDYRKVGLRPIITVPNLKQSSVSYINSYRNLAAKDLDTRFSVGDTPTFGIYPQGDSVVPIEWIVTDKADGLMLLVSKRIIETEDAANMSGSLEQWLSEEFFTKAFCCRHDEDQWLVNTAYEGDIEGCSTYKSLVFSLTSADFDYYKNVIGVPEVTDYAADNGVRIDGGRADWRLAGTWYVKTGEGKSPKGLRPAIQINMSTGEIVPRVLPPDYDDLSFPYTKPAPEPIDFATGESILFQAGYTVNARDNLSPERRRAILRKVIADGQMSRRAIVEHLKRCIQLRRNIPSMSNAIAKWRSDIDYLNQLWKH